jgi:tRNA-specific 2-thiouridylase
MPTKPSVLVGMSGGVDSSLTAALLQREGFSVVGGFIKNWSDSKDAWTGECQWRGERRDALRVAAKLGIPLLTFDFEDSYRERVVGELFRGYAAGETPNPDVLCNEAIKFGLFFEEAKRLGMDFVATGHYARIQRDADGTAHLLRGLDPDKDQSYFLYRVPQDVLRQTLFPIGELRKAEVRRLAAELDLPVADKPDSQGICFIGKLDMQDFLRTRIPPKAGDIVDEQGNVLGQHAGIDSLTIGQRQGIGVSKGEEPWFVADKDIPGNRIIVVQGAEHPRLYRAEAWVKDLHWTQGAAPADGSTVEVQVRYRQSPVKATATSFPRPPHLPREGGDLGLHLQFEVPVKAVAPGQSAVLYKGEECLGGGGIEG